MLAEGAGSKVKRIAVQAGKRLSYQRHARREKHWLVVGGAGRVTLDGDEFEVVSGVRSTPEQGAAQKDAGCVASKRLSTTLAVGRRSAERDRP